MSWEPFLLCSEDEAPPKPRPFDTPEGLGDRMRTAAFAEFQAIRAFGWAAERFDDVPEGLRRRWAELVDDEGRHFEMIVERMEALGVALDGRPVSLALWRSLEGCQRGRDFCIYIASAEERGRQAGLALIKALATRDPATAAVFQQIVDDEVEHVALAETYFDWTP